VGIWAMRLGVHIYLRNWGRGEDWRYAQWRAKWGHWWPLRSYLQVFLLQGLFMLVVALPMLSVNTFGGDIGWLALAGALVWLTGFLWETLADFQLVRFLKDPANKGKVLKTGLWRYSRHPNYFGEVVLWWGMWLIALSVLGAWWTVLSPLTITFLILKVSGVPLLESKMMKSDAYREYAQRTSGFIPWFPK
jgi:steroid 5-alpha reductase family enzyme